MPKWLIIAALFIGCSGESDDQPTQPDTQTTTDTERPPAPDWQEGDPVIQFYEGRRPQNVLFISWDTTRKDHLSPYDPKGRDLTPFMQTLYDQSVTLENHVQCSDWTYASTSCTLNGKYHEDNGFLPRLGGAVSFPDGQTTIAGLLGEQGYWSSLVATNAWLSSQWNNAQGYTTEPKPGGGPATNIAEKGVQFLKQDIDTSREKWFLHIHFMEAHIPYVPPAQYLEKLNELPALPPDMDLTKQNPTYSATNQWPNLSPDDQTNLLAHIAVRYEGEIRFLDDQMVAIWAFLENERMLDDTLVVFWNDHGEGMWEHGTQSHAHLLNYAENDGYLWFWSKNIVPRHYEGQTHSIDLMPTLMNALGYGTPADRSGVIAGTAPADRPVYTIVDGRDGIIQAVIKENWKLQFRWTGQITLYDRNADPNETNNLYSNTHPKAIELWELLLPRVLKASAIRTDKPIFFPDIGFEGTNSPSK